MAARYRLDPARSRFTVQAFASGLLSALGHSPTFAVRDFEGGMRFDGDGVESLRLDLAVRADSLDLIDRVRDSDRREITDRMRGDVLETATYREIAFHSEDVSAEPFAPGRIRVRIGGLLALHGATRPLRVDAELQLLGDGIRLVGQCPLHLAEYGIRPVTALGGAIKLKDELKISFDLAATPEAP